MARSRETKGFSFDMPINHYDLLMKIAKRKDMKASQIMRALLRDYLEREPK